MKIYFLTLALSVFPLSTVLSSLAFLTVAGSTSSSFVLATGGELDITVTGTAYEKEPVSPGEQVTLLPTVSNDGDYDVYLFSVITMSEDFEMDELSDGWSLLSSKTSEGQNVYVAYYRSDNKPSYLAPEDISIIFETATLNSELSIEENLSFDINVTVHAIQTLGFENYKAADLSGVLKL